MIQVHARGIICHGQKNFRITCCKLIDFRQLTNISMRTELEVLVIGCMTIPFLEVNDY
jgi:hypothetical protein